MGGFDKLPKLTAGHNTISALTSVQCTECNCAAQGGLRSPKLWIVQSDVYCAAQSAIVQRNDPQAVHATNFFRPFPGGQSKYFWCTSQISNKQIILFFNSRQNTLSTAGSNWKTIIVS